ncbi:MAG: hypothetical protein PHW08_07130 [Kiritimatiellae bacterium]|nr:hypothetical protein [Kiritimatiellia bacterium]
MAAAEMYDYLSTITADVDQTLAIDAQGSLTEEGSFNQVIHLADDASEERVTLSANPLFYVSWPWNVLTEAEAGTIFDLYFDAAKANGMGNSFKWTAHDGHTYVVRFDCKLSRTGQAVSRWGYPSVRLRVLGRIAD